ncbi:hypothetical protein Hanom_Chr09g00816691 [Helianthus anomalus]
MRLSAMSCASYPHACMPCPQPPCPCNPCAPPHAHGKKYKDGSQAAIRSAKCATLRLIAHATRAPFASTLSVCFHESIRMESFHLNTTLNFISSPMWDKMPLSLLFQHVIFQTPNFEHRYPIHLSTILDVV